MPELPSSQKPRRTIRCVACGAVFSNIPWMPGDACGKCGSTDTEPALVKGKTDYERADRSGAYAQEDLRFGRLAQWAEFVAPKQVQAALYEQSMRAKAKQPVPDIGALFMRAKLITQKQFDGVLRGRCSRSKSKEDFEFAKTAVQFGYITDEQVAECRQLQTEMDRSGRDVVPLPLLLLEKRYMQENQALALLKAEERQGKGLLNRIKNPPKEVSDYEGGAEGAKYKRKRRQVTLAMALVPLAILVMLLQFYRAAAPEVRAIARCPNCGETSAPAGSKWPAKCPQCKQMTLEPLAMCKQCGTRFVMRGMGEGSRCPKCRSTNYLPLTGENMKEAEELLIRIKSGGAAPRDRFHLDDGK